MTKFTRRAAIGSALGACVVGAPAFSVPAMAAGRLTIPANPMRLMRRIERELRDGRMLTVTREWQVDFAAQGRGIVINGEQVFAKVDAPEQLARLAAIEEARSTDSMFPILLGEAGEILAAGISTKQEDLAAAIREAEAMIKLNSSSATERAQRMAYLAQLQQAGGTLLEQMPRDLFYPNEEKVHSIKPVNLPDGSRGEFEFSFSARCAPGERWLAQAERQIITRIGDDERRSSETWALNA